MPFQRPVDSNHALMSGVVIGALAKGLAGTNFYSRLEDDEDGNHFAGCTLITPEFGTYRVIVEVIEPRSEEDVPPSR